MLEIIHPLTGEKLQVANNDFAQQMNWYQAIEACEKLGSGWRLPSLEELQVMYEVLHKKGKGNFKADGWYWSSAYRPSLALSFTAGEIEDYFEGDNNVRAVRHI